MLAFWTHFALHARECSQLFTLTHRGMGCLGSGAAHRAGLWAGAREIPTGKLTAAVVVRLPLPSPPPAAVGCEPSPQSAMPRTGATPYPSAMVYGTAALRIPLCRRTCSRTSRSAMMTQCTGGSTARRS